MYELMCGGRQLFVTASIPGEMSPDECHVYQMVEVMGPLPEHLADCWGKFGENYNGAKSRYISSRPLTLMLGKVEGASPAADLLQRVLALDREKRPSAAEILKHPFFEEE